MLDTFGKRLKACRAAGAVSITDLIEFVNSKGGSISRPTYSRWEKGDGGSILPKKKLYEIELTCEYLELHGVRVTSDWLIYNEGTPPIFVSSTNPHDNELFYTAAEMMERANGWKLMQISGSYGEPFVRMGESILLDVPCSSFGELHGDIALIKTRDNAYIGEIDVIDSERIRIINRKETILKIDAIIFAAKIKWIRKK